MRRQTIFIIYCTHRALVSTRRCEAPVGKHRSARQCLRWWLMRSLKAIATQGTQTECVTECALLDFGLAEIPHTHSRALRQVRRRQLGFEGIFHPKTLLYVDCVKLLVGLPTQHFGQGEGHRFRHSPDLHTWSVVFLRNITLFCALFRCS